MELPALLSHSLSKYAIAEDDSALLSQLIDRPIDLILFFEQACEDETWCEEHSEFIESALNWFTSQFFLGRLSLESALKVVQAFHKHYSVLKNMLGRDLTVNDAHTTIQANSLLMGASSRVLRDIIRRECRDREDTVLNITGISETDLMLFMEHIETGNIAGLWKYDKQQLFKLLRQAQKYDLLDAAKNCQEVLRRYVNRSNVIEMLIMAHNESWEHLEQICCDLINAEARGVKLETVTKKFGHVTSKERKPLSFEFLDFNDISLDLFDKLSHLVTHLVCSGVLINDPEFSRIMRTCRKLVSLDISRTYGFSEYLREMPSSLQELNLSNSPWLNGPYMRQIFQVVPHLSQLILSNNLQLNYAAWSELQHLRELMVLDVSHCHQLRDEDLSMIMKACYRLTYLNVSDCSQLTNKGFFDIARNLPQLITLDISYSQISDGLLLEILTQCRRLEYLNISHCKNLTEKGILHALKQGPTLRETKRR